MMGNKSIGDYLKNSWSNSWPMIFIMFFEFAIGITDVYIAGRISKEVQASIGFVTQLYFVLIIVGNAFTMGVVAVASRLYTADTDQFYKITYTAVVFTFLTSLFLMGLAFIFLPWINHILSPPEELKGYVLSLLQIYLFMIVFHYLLITTNGILRSSKRIKLSLLTMFVVCVVNIGTNIFYVFYIPIGYRGIALSTLTAIIIGSIINIYHTKNFIFKIKKFDKGLLKKTISIGWPSGVVQICWQSASIVIFMLLSNLPQNTIYMAAFTNGMRIESIIFLPAFAFSMANAVIVGNLLGEKRYTDAYRNSLWTSLLGCAIIILMTLIVVFNARHIATFLSNDRDVISASIDYIYISAVSEPFMALGTILIGGLNGAGDTRATMKRIIVSLWGVRIPLALFLGTYLGFGAYGIWWAMVISIMTQSILVYIRYKSKRWIKNEL